ncbi:hypothetical protein [Bergeriella denitrificans]|uniref:Uncharacterized protein n=1 Tax=Bergeriella denitrificans TaxID=494 RepID=A0A378UFL5_BERDE|nr:hypothetical protein [Bergeriella denitrificans]STZ75543.1 Uncharacterised protein [Bergeriella denitrificans]
MAQQTYTLTFSDDDLKHLDIAYFTLNYLAGTGADLDLIQGGLAALTETACQHLEHLYGAMYTAACEAHCRPGQTGGSAKAA